MEAHDDRGVCVHVEIGYVPFLSSLGTWRSGELVEEMPDAVVGIFSTIDDVNFIASVLAIVGDSKLVGRIRVHRQLHHFLYGVGVVGSAKVEADVEQGRPGKAAVGAVVVREVNLVVHLVDWRVLVPHHDRRVWLSSENGHPFALQEGVEGVGRAIVEEPHTIAVTLQPPHSPHKVACVAASVSHTEVQTGVIVHRSLHDVLHSVRHTVCDVIL